MRVEWPERRQHAVDQQESDHARRNDGPPGGLERGDGLSDAERDHAGQDEQVESGEDLEQPGPGGDPHHVALVGGLADGPRVRFRRLALNIRGRLEVVGSPLARVRDHRELRRPADLREPTFASGLPARADVPEACVPGRPALFTLGRPSVQRVPGLADAPLLDDVLPVVTVEVPPPPGGQVRGGAGNDQRRAADADEDQAGQDAVPDGDDEQPMAGRQSGHREAKPRREHPDQAREHRQRDDGRNPDPNPRRV